MLLNGQITIKKGMLGLVVLALLIPFLATSAWMFSDARDKVNRKLRSDKQLEAELLAESIGEPAWNLNIEAAEAMLKASVKHHKFLRAQFDFKEYGSPMVAESPELGSAITESISIPVSAKDRELGTLTVAFTTADGERQIWTSVLTLAGVNLIQMILCAAAIAWGLTKLIASPLVQIVSQAREMTDTKRHMVFITHTPALEMNQLTDALNDMQNRLASMLRELDSRNNELFKINNNLETVVEERTATKTRFITNMSHEIRTPLNGIIATSELLSESELPADKAELVRTIRFCAGSLLDVVNQILDYARISENKIDIKQEDFSAASLASDVMRLYRSTKADTAVKSQVDIGDNLPTLIHSDKKRLTQVLMNLVNNAFKFTEQGSVTLKVSNHPSKTQSICFAVVDTGIGISKEHIKNLGTAFAQEDASINRKYGGTGLGLAISMQIIKSLGGELEITSTKGSGSTFTVTIPYALPVIGGDIKPTLPVNKQTTTMTTTTAPAGDVQFNLNILVAEDNETNRLVLRRHLEKLGCTVSFAHNGIEAITLNENDKFDLILMDMQMPLMGGAEASAKITAARKPGVPYPPIYMLSASTAEEMQIDLKKFGISGSLLKPFQRDQLIELLKKGQTEIQKQKSAA